MATKRVATLKMYYRLTKPGIVYGNTMTAGGGFLLASRGDIRVVSMLGALLGIALVIAAACVINNSTDRRIDQKMARTKKRALASGAVSVRSAVLYALILGAAGFSLLALYANWLTVVLGIVALIDYTVLYAYAKRHSPWGTIVGSMAGALPVTAGYTAVSGQLDTGALLIFLIMTTWQMPHFYAIAMYRANDYRAADLPVLPIKKGFTAAKWRIVGYIGAFLIAITLLTAYDYAGYSFLVVMLGLGLVWLQRALRGFTAPDDVRWARSLFGFSLIVLLGFSLMMALDALLP